MATREEERTDPRALGPGFPCESCVHVLEWGLQDHPTDKAALTEWTCKAYPKGIPKKILRRQTKHTKKLKGQVGSFKYTSNPETFYDGTFRLNFAGIWKKVKIEEE